MVAGVFRETGDIPYLVVSVLRTSRSSLISITERQGFFWCSYSSPICQNPALCMVIKTLIKLIFSVFTMLWSFTDDILLKLQKCGLVV